MDDLTPATDLLSDPEGPGEPSQTARWAGRRLMDALNAVFQLALYRGDVRSAAELFTVMERRYGREQSRLRYEKRHADPLVALCRRELQARRAAHRRGVRGGGI
jgi:hypothetical protein